MKNRLTHPRKLYDSEILAAAKTIVRMDSKPLEIFDMLGITYDLYRLQASRRQKSVSTPSRMSR